MTRKEIIGLMLLFALFILFRLDEIQKGVNQNVISIGWVLAGLLATSIIYIISENLNRVADEADVSKRTRKILTWMSVMCVAVASPLFLTGVPGTMLIIGSFLGLLIIYAQE